MFFKLLICGKIRWVVSLIFARITCEVRITFLLRVFFGNLVFSVLYDFNYEVEIRRLYKYISKLLNILFIPPMLSKLLNTVIRGVIK